MTTAACTICARNPGWDGWTDHDHALHERAAREGTRDAVLAYLRERNLCPVCGHSTHPADAHRFEHQRFVAPLLERALAEGKQ